MNTADAACRRPRFVVPREAVERFERARSAAQPKVPPRHKRRAAAIDFFPD